MAIYVGATLPVVVTVRYLDVPAVILFATRLVVVLRSPRTVVTRCYTGYVTVYG